MCKKNVQSKLILASTSKYRVQMLKKVGLIFSSTPHRVNERELEKNIELKDLSSYLAFAKAKSLKLEDQAIILGSDQVCIFGSETLNKSKTKEAAIEQLLRLSGQTHKLYTSYALLHGDKALQYTDITTLKMKKLDKAAVTQYVEFDNPIDCAGSYKIESGGIGLFEEVKTEDFNSIVGLPLVRLLKDLEGFGVFPWN